MFQVFVVFLVRMRENTDRKNYEYGQFSRSEGHWKKITVLLFF